MSKRDRDRQRQQRESAPPQTPVSKTEAPAEQQPTEAGEAQAPAGLAPAANGDDGGLHQAGTLQLSGEAVFVSETVAETAAIAPSDDGATSAAVPSEPPVYVDASADAPRDPSTPVVLGHVKRVDLVKDPDRRVRVRALAEMVFNWGASHFRGQEFSMREEDALRALEKGAIEILD